MMSWKSILTPCSYPVRYAGALLHTVPWAQTSITNASHRRGYITSPVFGHSKNQIDTRKKPLLFHDNHSMKKLSTFDQLELPSPVYELRTYTFVPVNLKKGIELFEKYMHLRMKHSELVGFWTTEIGESIHQVAHIWQYDTLGHRLKVRKGLLDDAEWQSSFMKNFLPNVQEMTNSVMVPVPGTSVQKNLSAAAGGVYTLEHLSAGASPPGSESEDHKLIGRFFTVLGSTGTEYRLWRHQDVDGAMALSWANLKGSSGGNISTVLLHPAKFSPMQ